MASLHNLPFRRRWTLGVVLVAIALGGYLGWLYVHGSRIGTAAPGETKGSEMLPPIPVTVAQVKTADFPVYLNGLGTVEPFRTVTVRSRVDGEITKVAFKQGQMIKEGDLLVQIDPRPYQAVLPGSVAREEGAGCKANPENALHRPAALCLSCQKGLNCTPTARYTESDGRSTH